MTSGLSESSFYKWRTLIALSHVDGKLDPGERDFFSKELKSLNEEQITAEQMDVLVDDLKNPKSPDVFFVRVSEKTDQIDLLRLAHFLFWSDGDYDSREKKVYEYLRESISISTQIKEEILDQLARVKTEGDVSIKKLLEEYLYKDVKKKSD